MRKSFIASLSVLLVSAFWMNVSPGCANMVPPSGGPRDSLPPVLEMAIPGDSSVNFSADRISFTFDEEVDVKDLQNIIYTPTLDNIPNVTAKGRTITVKFGDTLDTNTTYVINFGNSIIDFTESNPLKNFVYTFSTGAVLDSLEISGKVLLAENNTADSTLLVVLHKDLRDSAVNKMPRYVTKLDRDGNFHFRNLPSDTFAIYAIGGGQRMYQVKSNLFAFHNTPIIAGQADSLVLFAYRETTTAIPATPQTQTNIGKISNNDRRLRLNPVTSAQQDLLNDYVINFSVPLRSFDSTKMHLVTDSLFYPANFTASLDTAKKELRIKTQWKENINYHLILEKDFATDTAGRQLLKTDTLSFVSKKTADYGSLSLRIRNLNLSKNPVLQFMQNNKVVFSTPVKSGVFNQTLFLPGEYSLRIFYDANNNGKWDPGQFFGEKRQPEKVEVIGQTITVKANWDNEFERSL